MQKVCARKQIGTQISLIVNADDWALFSGWCDESGFSRATVFRAFIKKFLAMPDAEKKTYKAMGVIARNFKAV